MPMSSVFIVAWLLEFDHNSSHLQVVQITADFFSQSIKNISLQKQSSAFTHWDLSLN